MRKAFNDDSIVGTEAGANDSESSAQVTSLDRLRDDGAIGRYRQNKVTGLVGQYRRIGYQKHRDRRSQGQLNAAEAAGRQE